MAKDKTALHKLIDSGNPVLMARMSPPKAGDPDLVRETAKRFAGKVHALGISENRDGVCMSALAAAALVAGEGVEPLLHMVTRDHNRIALIANCLGAEALGIRNILCTSGTHQTLGNCRAARNVFDIDSVQLLRAITNLANDASIVGEDKLDGSGPFCLGAVAAPYADPIEMQPMRLAKKISSGARFLITQPIFDLDRFDLWWKEVTSRGLHEQTAIIAGIRPLTNAVKAAAYAERRPLPMVPNTALERVTSQPDETAQRAAGIEIAVETIKKLSALDGLRGFEISCDGDHDAVLETIEKSGLEAG